MTDADLIMNTTEAMILDALRSANRPVDAAQVIESVRDETNVRLPRATADAALKRLAAKSLAVYVDDPGCPRRWSAIP